MDQDIFDGQGTSPQWRNASAWRLDRRFALIPVNIADIDGDQGRCVRSGIYCHRPLRGRMSAQGGSRWANETCWKGRKYAR
jgi:hypothetical protein